MTTKSRVQFRAMTLRQAELEEDTRIYALNRSSESANININITLKNGERSLITLPFSPCPVDLSVFAPKEDLLAAPVFRRLVAGGYVVLVETEQADDFVHNDPRGIRETRRIFKETSVINENIAGNVETEFAQADTRSEAERAGAESSNIFVESILARATDPNEDINDLIADLESRIHTLEAKDIQYIVDNCDNAELKEWAIMMAEDGEETEQA